MILMTAHTKKYSVERKEKWIRSGNESARVGVSYIWKNSAVCLRLTQFGLVCVGVHSQTAGFVTFGEDYAPQ